MPDYSYKAADASGKISRGYLFAPNADELRNRIRETGYHLLEYSEAKKIELYRLLTEVQIGGLTRSQLIEFSNNMGVMLKAGVPLLNALDELREDYESKHFQKILTGLMTEIQEGSSLNDAMRLKPKDFPELFVSVIQIGEQTGNLDSVFFDLARHYKRIDDLIKNVRKAMIYPAFIVVGLLIASLVFLTMVFPPVFAMINEFDVELPLITKIVMFISSAIENHWPLILAGFLGIIILFILLRKNDKTKYYVDLAELKLPYFKKLFLQLRLAFFLRYLALVLTAGIDILKGLELSTRSIPNLVIRDIIAQSRQKVTEGELFSKALRGYKVIPNMVVRMIGIGEGSGNLPEQMDYVADYYNEQLERSIESALALLEPILLVILAGFALSLIAAVMLPIYDLVSQLSSQAGTGGF